jgi:hypothetical protein
MNGIGGDQGMMPRREGTMTDKVCPFMSHRGGELEVIFCYREKCAAWKTHPSIGHRSDAGSGGYCVRIWGPE